MLILASKSPRRKELFALIAPNFKVIPSSFDERVLDSSLNPKDLAIEESKMKAYTLFSKYPNDEVLSCDTIVILNGKALEKPIDEEDAIRMLKEEQGKKQIVLSAYTYISKEREISRTVSTEVYFHSLSEEKIKEYVRLHKPLDKAGAYGIQDDYPLIERIVGSYYNVMGLPVEDLKKRVFTR